MLKKLHLAVICLLLSVLTLQSFSANAQNHCDPCEDIPWNAEQIHQFFFNPSDYPSCLAFAEIHYRTKMCNGMLLYEITFVEYTFISGGCCQFAHLHKDVEKEMILNVLGTPNVISSKPTSCYRELELDATSDPGFIDCWTHHGELKFEDYNPIMFYPCSKTCCVAKASVKYDQRGRPIIFWEPLNQSECDDKIEPPKDVTLTICCETVIDSTGEAICTDFKTFTLKVKAVSDTCIAYCESSIFFRQTPGGDNQNLVQDNINFLHNTKAYPNPFGNSLNISLALPDEQAVTVEILDMKGQRIKEYQLQYQVGQTAYTLDALGELSSGFYLCRVTTASYGNKIIKIRKE